MLPTGLPCLVLQQHRADVLISSFLDLFLLYWWLSDHRISVLADKVFSWSVLTVATISGYVLYVTTISKYVLSDTSISWYVFSVKNISWYVLSVTIISGYVLSVTTISWYVLSVTTIIGYVISVKTISWYVFYVTRISWYVLSVTLIRNQLTLPGAGLTGQWHSGFGPNFNQFNSKHKVKFSSLLFPIIDFRLLEVLEGMGFFLLLWEKTRLIMLFLPQF